MENVGVCTKERKGITAEVLMATPCTKSLGGESGGHSMEEMWGAGFAGSSPPFLCGFFDSVLRASPMGPRTVFRTVKTESEAQRGSSVMSQAAAPPLV